MLSAREIRARAAELDIRPTKQWGQNFVVDANTVERIVRLAEVHEDDVVVEVGPGLGSLTLALLPRVARVVAIEVDPVLAAALPDTVADQAPAYRSRLDVVHQDALTVTTLPGPDPTALVANLPYNVSVPVVLRFLERFPGIRTMLVMVQLEVAHRLAASPGTKIYGVPSVKAAWYADVRLVGTVPRTVFWPVPNVDSGLVRLDRREPPAHDVGREAVFACVDAAFAQRRKTLRAALAGWAGSPAAAEEALRAAGIDPRTRGEQLTVGEFTAVARAREQSQR
ncbi:16S rRNA (adenine(1518)-N(6)/adenine(1519)-N(6))-dimethyltransferase RsmA [Nostocoides sp. F2B08]|uniref:16S rRNA (adenine(1518)-N(6)/adenine(1519)-N(6))- dimethyltransferase RsmA n=1 Tax=Nostocoides sp. F2B08 TaxID=2653936 RepID=UPI001D0480A6|nr:16S rRNA (adenine(1518)-N(6)/adenine(1519)-N(6))-dimethyltransferase RsmA [Tetrasphaera sp. F2B08]